MYAYDSCYTADAQENIGNMLDYAVYSLGISLKNFWQMFLKSTISGKIARGDAACLAGNSGIELAWKVLEENAEGMAETGNIPGTVKKADDILKNGGYRNIAPAYHRGRSREYWTGWGLTYYQWQSGFTFQQIESEVPIIYVAEMYEKYHEMDILHFCEEMSRLSQAKRVYTYAKYFRQRLGISQKEAAEEAGIPIRTLQQYEQKQKNINKASAETIIRLAKVYGVRPEDLLEQQIPVIT